MTKSARLNYPPSKDLAGAELRTFFRIAERWHLSDPQKVAILRLENLEQLADLAANPSLISKDTLERISYVLGIFKAINTLLPLRERADGWIRAPNSAAFFDGRSPLALMANGELEAVRRYLDAQVEASFT